MSVLTRSFRWMVFTCAMLSGSIASAQYHPFAEPLEFDPDWQWFAPVHLQDFDEMTSKQRANRGWFATYDRLHQGVSRPLSSSERGRIDFTWGNRFDFGWMGNNDTGWLMSATHIAGPNAYDTVYQNRLNIVNDNDVGDPLNPIFPRYERNDPQYLERVYFVRQSLNTGSFSSFEINKTWRMEPYRYGGILEPMLGMKFADFTDEARNDSYDTFNVDLDGDGTVDVNREVYTKDIVATSNRMVLGQIGFRYIKYSNRWTLSTDAKAFAGGNFQFQHSSLLAYTTDYTAPVARSDAPISEVRTGTAFSGRHNNETTLGMEIRAEAGYAVSKYINLRFGGNLLYFGDGIWRGATNTGGGNQFLQNQALVMPGFSFGFAVNR